MYKILTFFVITIFVFSFIWMTNESNNPTYNNTLQSTMPDEDILYKDKENNIEKLYQFFSKSQYYFYKDIVEYEEEIINITDEVIDNIGSIQYRVYGNYYGYINKQILIKGENINLEYSFFTKGDDLHGVRKKRIYNNVEKKENNLKVDTENITDCYISQNNCGKDAIFLYDFMRINENNFKELEGNKGDGKVEEHLNIEKNHQELKEEINVDNNISQAEKENIDEYNFKQLEKAKNILDLLNNDSYNFYNLKQFNENFNQDIKPVKNCYFIADRNRFFKEGNGGGGYVFGFKLESEKYIKKYGTEYYVYPKYDLPKSEVCFGMGSLDSCNDRIKQRFEKIISTPCE